MSGMPYSKINIGDVFQSPFKWTGSDITYTVVGKSDGLIEVRSSYQHPAHPETMWKKPSDRIFGQRRIMSNNAPPRDKLAALRAELDAARQHVTAVERDNYAYLDCERQWKADLEAILGGPRYDERTGDEYSIDSLIDTIRQQLAERDRQIRALRDVCADAYQMAGALHANEKALDNLCAAAEGEPIPHETFLPVDERDCLWCKGAQDENRRLREALNGLKGLVSQGKWIPTGIPVVDEQVNAHNNCMSYLSGKIDAALAAPAPESDEQLYPCDKCGKLRTKAEGGTTFTVCDECWGKLHSPAPESVKEETPCSE